MAENQLPYIAQGQGPGTYGNDVAGSRSQLGMGDACNPIDDLVNAIRPGTFAHDGGQGSGGHRRLLGCQHQMAMVQDHERDGVIKSVKKSGDKIRCMPTSDTDFDCRREHGEDATTGRCQQQVAILTEISRNVVLTGFA